MIKLTSLRKFFPLLTYVCFLIGCVIYLALNLNSSKLESSVLSLLPNMTMGKAPQDLSDKMLDRLNQQVIFLVSDAKDPQQALQAAKLLVSSLESSYFKQITGEQSVQILNDYGKFFFEHRTAFITPEIRSRLDSMGEYVLSQLYSSFAGVSSTELSADLLLLTRQEQIALSSGSKLTLDHNFLAVTDESGKRWYFVHAEISGSSFALQRSNAVVKLINTACQQVTEQYPNSSILKRGAVFYSAHASQSAFHDLTVLGSSTVLLVVLLLILAFRSIVPLILTCISVISGLLLGVTASLAIFDSIHSFTLIVSMSIIGMACDYTLYFVTVSKSQNVCLSALRKALLTALFTTCISYIVMLFTPFPGIKQMAVLALAALCGSCCFVLLLIPLVKSQPAETSKVPTDKDSTDKDTIEKDSTVSPTQAATKDQTAHVTPTDAIDQTASAAQTSSTPQVATVAQVDTVDKAAFEAKVTSKAKVAFEDQVASETKVTSEDKITPVAQVVTVDQTTSKSGCFINFWIERYLNARKVHLICLVLSLLIGITGIWQLRLNDDIASFADMPAQLQKDDHTIAQLLGQNFDQRYLLLYAKDSEHLLQLHDNVHQAILKVEGLSVKTWPLNSALRQSSDHELLTQAYQTTRQELEAYGIAMDFAPLPELKILSQEQFLSSPVAAGFKLLSLQSEDYQALLLPISKMQDRLSLVQALNNLIKTPQTNTLSEQIQAGQAGVVLIDTKHDFDQLFQTYRSVMSGLLGLALFLIWLSMVVRLGVKSGSYAFLPTIASIICTLGLLGWLGFDLNIFVIFALILILGVGINYSLFFLSHATNAKSSLFGITLACLTTECTLGILALSSTPAVQSFGITLFMGVLTAYLLAPIVQTQDQDKNNS